MNGELEYAISLKREYEKQNLFKNAMDVSGLQEIAKMYEQHGSRQGLTNLIGGASSYFGFGDVSKLNQDQMNTLGGKINDQMFSGSLWLKRLYPDKEERNKVISAWKDFYDEYWNVMS